MKIVILIFAIIVGFGLACKDTLLATRCAADNLPQVAARQQLLAAAPVHIANLQPQSVHTL